MRKLLFLMSALLFNLQSVFAFNVDAFIDNKVAPITNKIAAIVFTSIKVGSVDFHRRIFLYFLLKRNFYLRFKTLY